jgi:hypothetical protein
MKNDFIPAKLADLDAWQKNFKEKAPKIAGELKIEAAVVTPVLDSIDASHGTYATMLSKRKEGKAATSAHSAQQAGTVKQIRELSNQFKSVKGYTEAMGMELGIIGIDTGFDKSVAKPSLTAGREGAGIVIKFAKDQTDGIHIYSRRGDEKAFTFLAVDTVPPYHDNRANLVAGQAEMREYKAWYFMDEDIIGQESDVVSISV